jgi:hypothetical protein
MYSTARVMAPLEAQFHQITGDLIEERALAL